MGLGTCTERGPFILLVNKDLGGEGRGGGGEAKGKEETGMRNFIYLDTVAELEALRGHWDMCKTMRIFLIEQPHERVHNRPVPSTTLAIPSGDGLYCRKSFFCLRGLCRRVF